MPATPKSAMRTRRQQQASQAYQDAKARKACVEAVWKRAALHADVDGAARCEGCGCYLLKWVRLYEPWMGHVHEKRARSLGGNPHDPDQCELLCHSCHFNGPSGAHRRSVRATV